MTISKRTGSRFWQYEFEVQGRRYRGSCETANKAEAQAFEVKRKQEVREDLALSRAGVKRVTLGALTDQWLEAAKVTHKDWKNDESRVRKLFGEELRPVKGKRGEWEVVTSARFGLPRDLMVHEITQAMVTTLRDKRLAEGNTPATVNREMSLIQALIGYATSQSIVTPAVPIVWSAKRNKTASLKMKEAKGKLRYLSLEDEAKLLVSLEVPDKHAGQALAYQDAQDLVVFLLDTGARHDEVAKMRWDCVDLVRGTVNLYRSKTDNESELRMTRRLQTMLTRRRQATAGRSYIFPAYLGNGYHPEDKPRGHATKYIQSKLDACGFNAPELVKKGGRVTPHTFRDTFASRLVQAGVSLYKVSRLLGHANEAMTKKYAHLNEKHLGIEAANVLDNLHGGGRRHDVLVGDDPIAALPAKRSGHDVLVGDDPIAVPTEMAGPHNRPHGEAPHSQRLALRFSMKKAEALMNTASAAMNLVGRSGLEPLTNGLKEGLPERKSLIYKDKA